MKSQNGHEISERFLMRLNLQQFADPGDPDAGNNVGGEDSSAGTGAAGNAADGGEGGNQLQGNEGETGGNLAEELERMRGELEKYKKAIDKATKEAADNKRALKEKEQALRSKQTAEEIAAEEKKAQDEQTAKEIDELRREVARTKAVKSVMSKLGTDEETSGKIAEYLYGAEDVDNALMEIQRAWTAREKALKLEYGKVPPPGAGGANGEDKETQEALRIAKELGQRKAQSAASVRDQLKGLVR